MKPALANPEIAIQEAVALRDAGRGAEAAALMRSLLHRHPQNARLWQTLGTIHRALQESDAAVAAFVEAARLEPGSVRACYGIAQATLEAGRPAAAMFDRLHLMAPSDGSIPLGRAAAHLAEGHVGAAIDGLDAIVGVNPLWLDGQATLARLRWAYGDRERFDVGYRRALSDHGSHMGLWLGLIELLLQVERFEDARRVIADARTAIGNSPLLTMYAAQSASEAGDEAVADAEFAKLCEAVDGATVEQHVRHLLRSGRPEAAFARIDPHLERETSGRLWPYASLVWRVLGDRRAAWLEGDPALIGVQDLGLSNVELTSLAEVLRQLHVARADPLGQSVRHGTQTDGPLFAHAAPEIRRLREAVTSAVDRYVETIGPRDPTHPTRRHIGKRYRFAGSWSVRLSGTGHHSVHVHPQGWLSSACYVAVPPITERGPAPAGWLQLGAPPRSLKLDLQPYRRVEPSPGTLVLFPSTMWHGTEPIGGGERLSVAFDVAAIG